MYYQATFTLDGRDTDGRGNCRISSLLGYLQRAAMGAAAQGGFGHRELLERYGAVWMLARTWVKLFRPIRWDDVITVKTWHRGGKGAMMYRDYDIYVGEDLVGESVSGWVFVDVSNRRLMHLSDVSELEGTTGGTLCKEKTLMRWKAPQNMTQVEARLMHYSDCDINGHVNNTRYADFVQDALHQEGRNTSFVSEMQLNYTKECLAGEVLSVLAEETEDGCFVLGMDKDGKRRFEGRVIFSEDIH